MACGGCGKGVDRDRVGTLRASAYQPDTDIGLYALASQPDCSDAYHGVYTTGTVYVLARGTEREQLFVRGQRVEASRIARRDNVTLDSVRADQLCHDAVLELFGA